ncbi:CYFA0S01e03928g1_1 [Cyberlindnera fabianii]|uniref:CYFA0S01e03928g1_1 n=1 Tax=Cyberlindnera fabianii TaxID=36022 RepID=A0A061AHX4_CYBFA|nr:CYFA0S01e03928g1_1 [Cyberlindnera fabianii]
MSEFDVRALTEKHQDQDYTKDNSTLSRVTTDKTTGDVSTYLESKYSSTTYNDNTSSDNDFSDIDDKVILRKIDMHLLPICGLLYLLAYLDRGAIGNAKIEGLTDSLRLSTNEYNICLTIFFITYSLCEIPSNMLLKKLGKQSIFIPVIMICWGIVMTCMGVVKDFGGLFATRLLLGVFEAGLYPGMSFGLTMWYKRTEMQSRQALFYAAASMAGAFSGLLAFAIAKMDGAGGYEGWRWIFILEGILTVVVAVAAFKLMPDYPGTAKFLTPREREYVLWRAAKDSEPASVFSASTMSSRRVPDYSAFTDKHDVSMSHSLKNVFTDWQPYIHVLLNLGIVTPTYGISLFLPSVVKGLGYTSSMAQLMTIPIYIAASIISVIQAFASDYFKIRSAFVAADLLAVIIGFVMAIAGQETGENRVIYAGVFIAVIGLYAAFPGIISWLSNNLANSQKRAIGMAFQIGFGNMGGAFASNFYKPDQYTLGHSLELGFATMGFICCIISVMSYKAINNKREKEIEAGKWDDVSDEDLFKMGDKSPYFRYRL